MIFNCVRANTLNSVQGSLGFLTDVRRLNVAITRPRHFLFVVGNAKTLLKCDTWAKMVRLHEAKQKEGGYFRLDQNCEYYSGSPEVIEQFVVKQSDTKARITEMKKAEVAHRAVEDVAVE